MVPVTVIIPTSPIPEHPEVDTISKVITSLKRHLPGSQILIMCDGVRPQVEHRRAQYNAYKDNLRTFGVEIVEFDEPMQQTRLLKHALTLTPDDHLVMFIEHDIVLDDKPINWDRIKELASQGHLVRPYWNQGIHPEHEYLMCGELEPEFIKSRQFSGWCNVGTKAYWQRVVDTIGYQNVMIETPMYSLVVESPWETWKNLIYLPAGDSIRFHHLDGRQGDQKEW